MRAPTLATILSALPQGSREIIEALLAEATRREAAVYLVGGPVRDLLLGRPLHDVDLIVEPREGVGAEALARTAAPAQARVTSHGRFGTVRIETAEAGVDLANLRRESYARPGALPSVEPGTLEEDLRRRDFTVNALALPLSAAARRARGGVIDVEDGRRDLETRTLRVLHARSFHDDPTRALRAGRFAARLGFRLSRGSRSALRDALRDGVFGAVSGDRLRREFEKLFADAGRGVDPGRVLRLLDDWHVLGALEPGLGVPRPALVPLRRLGRAIAAPPWPALRRRDWGAGLAVWLAAVDATVRQRALRRLSVRGELAQRIADFPKERDAWLKGLGETRGRGAIDALLRDVDEERLLALYAWAPPTGRRRVARWANEDRDRRAPITGADLVALGLDGPAVGRALARIRAAFLDAAVRDREEALTLARELARTDAPRRRSGGGRSRRRPARGRE